MASECYLYSPETNEAVEVMRKGANGLQTPQGSPRALFGFMSYHMGKNATYRLAELQCIGELNEEIEFADSLKELEDKLNFDKKMGGNSTFVLLWQEESVNELLGRSPEQLKAMDDYEFIKPKHKHQVL